tara:strand:- start:31 stop:210 length:180 start_codon:yes stop_codon:yes gene_type:complete
MHGNICFRRTGAGIWPHSWDHLKPDVKKGAQYAPFAGLDFKGTLLGIFSGCRSAGLVWQ